MCKAIRPRRRSVIITFTYILLTIQYVACKKASPRSFLRVRGKHSNEPSITYEEITSGNVFTPDIVLSKETSRSLLNSRIKTEEHTTYITRRFSTKNSTKSNTLNSIYPNGWIPSKYPNPVSNPKNCHISSDDSHLNSFKPHDGDGTLSSGISKSVSPILVCDPDGVLSSNEMSGIINALQNFTVQFNDYRSTSHINDNGEKGEGKKHPDTLAVQPGIAVSIVSQMDLTEILQNFAFYTFEDEIDMVNDAAQYFANYIHNKWFGEMGADVNGNQNDSYEDIYSANGILIFISVEDFVCYISAGSGVTAVLPWWRLLRVMDGMVDRMDKEEYDSAIIGAIGDIAIMLDEGPPSTSERIVDFLRNFGPILFFTALTMVLAAYGEQQDRLQRYHEAEVHSALDAGEKEKAEGLQSKYKCIDCPICLEPFPKRTTTKSDDCIPYIGSDGQKVKMLRCGHIFDRTCWKCWVLSGSNGDPHLCPVCRQDISDKGSISSIVIDSSPLLSNLNPENNYGTSSSIL